MSGGGAEFGKAVKDTTGMFTGIFQGQGQGGTQGRDSSMPAYGSQTTSPSPNHYNPTYAPMQQSSQQSPLQQAPKQSVQDMGLEALYQSMSNQFAPISQQLNSMDQFYQQPTQQQQMPMYQNSSLNYRPDMSGITANLNRVAPSVVLQQRQAAEAQAAWDAAHPVIAAAGGDNGSTG
jgi:hypothetical protein